MNPELKDRISFAFGLAACVGLTAMCIVTLLPLLLPILWAIICVLTSWPLYRRVSRIAPKRPTVTALIMTAGLAAVFFSTIVPLLLMLSNEVERSASVVRQYLLEEELRPPEWVARLPLVGPASTELAGKIANDRPSLREYFEKNPRPFLNALRAAAKGVGESVFTFVLCLVFSFFMYRNGMLLAQQLGAAATRIGGQNFKNLLGAIRDTVRGAVYGALLTALVQGSLAGIGYAVAGAPVPVLLGFVTMFASLLPFGAPFVYVPVSLMILATTGSLLKAGLLLLWGMAFVSTVDNILRPIFISQATAVPLALSFVGVLGGLLQFGFIGLVLGPVTFAVAHTLWQQWLSTTATP